VGDVLIVSSKYKSSEVSLVELLLWASSNAFDTLQVRPNVQDFGKNCIQHDLVKVSQSIISSHGPQHPNLHKLWSGLFAPLLRLGSGNSGLDYTALVYIGASQHPPNMLWPKCARLFSYLWHGTIDSHQAEELLDYSQFLDCHATLPSFLFNNIVIVKPDPISLAWQELLLSKPITITLDRGFENLFVAAIKENRDRQINLKSPPFKELVLDLKDRIQFPKDLSFIALPDCEMQLSWLH